MQRFDIWLYRGLISVCGVPKTNDISLES